MTLRTGLWFHFVLVLFISKGQFSIEISIELCVIKYLSLQQNYLFYGCEIATLLKYALNTEYAYVITMHRKIFSFSAKLLNGMALWLNNQILQGSKLFPLHDISLHHNLSHVFSNLKMSFAPYCCLFIELVVSKFGFDDGFQVVALETFQLSTVDSLRKCICLLKSKSHWRVVPHQ